jgi:peroxiredoxin
MAGRLASLRVTVLGISPESRNARCAAAESLGLQFGLLGDVHSEISTRYGALHGWLPWHARCTALVDSRGTVRALWHGRFDLDRHGEEVGRRITELQAEELKQLDRNSSSS